MMLEEKTFEEIRNEYEDYLELFEHPMWIKFIETQVETLDNDQKNAHRTHATNDEWQQLRGHIALMERIIGFEDTVRGSIDQLNEAIAERDTEEEESDFDN